MRKFDPAGIERGIACLRPDNFRYTLVSQTFPGTWKSTEKWYGTEYTYEKIPANLIAAFEQAVRSTASNRLKDLRLPHRNEFIPTKYDVEKKSVAKAATEPKLSMYFFF